MSFVCVDIGASSSRYVSNSGQIGVLPNNMVMLPDMQVTRIVPESTDIESSLEVQIVKNTPSLGPVKSADGKTDITAIEAFPVNVLVGIMATKYSRSNMVPNINTSKHTQPINYISAILSCAVSMLKESSQGNVESSVDLYLAVPPQQLAKAEQVFPLGLVGSYTVKFPKYMGGTEVNFTVSDVRIFEESYMACTSFFFNMNGTVREEAKSYLSGNVMSVDIGASTTDFTIVKNGRYMNKSGKTYPNGGRDARDTLIDLIKETYDFEVTPDGADVCMAEGRVQRGNKFIDIGDLVIDAKKQLVDSLMQRVGEYFHFCGIPLQEINIIVVSGGGSLESKYANSDGEIVKTADSISTLLLKELLKLCPDVDVIPYGEEARFANVRGLFIRAKTDELMKSKAQNMGAAPKPQAQPVGTPVKVVTDTQPQTVQAAPQAVQAAPQVASVQSTPVTQSAVTSTVQTAQPQETHQAVAVEAVVV